MLLTVVLIGMVINIALIINSLSKDLNYYKTGYERCVKQMNIFISNDIENDK